MIPTILDLYTLLRGSPAAGLTPAPPQIAALLRERIARLCPPDARRALVSGATTVECPARAA